MLLRILLPVAVLLSLPSLYVAEKAVSAAQPIQTMHFMSRSIGGGEFQYEQLEESLFKMIYVTLAPEIDADIFKTALGRGINLIENEANYCSYNILKSEQREKSMLFSRYPSSIYPKRKLFFINPDLLALPQKASIATLSATYKIGLVAQAYFGALKSTVNVHSDNLVFIEGLDSHKQLVNMLLKGRLDLIVEYQSVLDSYAKETEIKSYSIDISEYESNEVGYFVCNKSEMGEKVIRKIDQLYQTHAFQQWLKDYHYQHFTQSKAIDLLKVYQNEYHLNWLEPL